jgi:ABC-2 type transport system ATP-binding protein
MVSVPEIWKEVTVDGNIIELKGLTKRYGQFTAVDNLDLSIRKGEVFGLLGPNGAGKSTTILMMLGLTEPTSGTVTVCGLNPASDPVGVKRKVGYLPEEVGFYADRTGLENLTYTACLNGMPFGVAKEKAIGLLERIGIGDEKCKKTGKYSRGMRQRLGLADVLIKDPKVIILDEPTLGIDPSGVREFLDLIIELSTENKITVLLSSHQLHQVQQVCDRVGIFVKGRLLATGDIMTLASTLFSKNPYTVEVGINYLSTRDEDESGEPANNSQLVSKLKQLDGVNKINDVNGILQVECSRDITSDIVSLVISSGAQLTSLNMKEYGLDDIYYRYFEGGAAHD